MHAETSSGALSCRLTYACENFRERPCSMLQTTSIDALVVKPCEAVKWFKKLPGSILGFALRQINLYLMESKLAA